MVEPEPRKGSRTYSSRPVVKQSISRSTSAVGNMAGCFQRISSGVLRMSLQTEIELRVQAAPSRSFARRSAEAARSGGGDSSRRLSEINGVCFSPDAGRDLFIHGSLWVDHRHRVGRRQPLDALRSG